MVEMITRYRTEDGLDFPTREEAEKHERTAVPRMLAGTIFCAPILMFALWLAPKILEVVGLLWLLGWLK